MDSGQTYRIKLFRVLAEFAIFRLSSSDKQKVQIMKDLIYNNLSNKVWFQKELLLKYFFGKK